MKPSANTISTSIPHDPLLESDGCQASGEDLRHVLRARFRQARAPGALEQQRRRPYAAAGVGLAGAGIGRCRPAAGGADAVLPQEPVPDRRWSASEPIGRANMRLLAIKSRKSAPFNTARTIPTSPDRSSLVPFTTVSYSHETVPVRLRDNPCPGDLARGGQSLGRLPLAAGCLPEIDLASDTAWTLRVDGGARAADQGDRGRLELRPADAAHCI